MRISGVSSSWVTAGCIMLLLAGAALALESITLQRPVGNTSSSADYGVLLFGRSAVHRYGPGPTPINIQSSDTPLTSVVAFAAGLAPIIGTRTPGTGATLTFNPPLVIPLKIWTLCVNQNCNGPFTDQFKEKLETFLFKANEFLERERTGLVLGKAGTPGSDEWISNQTANIPKRDQFKNFTTREDADDCAADRLGVLTDQMKDAGALNMYLVGRVDGEAGRGESCLEPDISVIGAAALWHTMLHEVGHNLGLLHVDGRQIRHYVPSENLMHKASSERRFVSEGQTFLINFDSQSALKRVFSNLLPAPRPFRDCTNSQVECPPLTTWIWDDQN